MYKIQTPNGETYLTEKPNYIRLHTNGCYILTDPKNAQGIAYHGTPYLFKDGVICFETDAGKTIEELLKENEVLNNTLAETDLAIIEIYESLGVSNNG